MARTIVQEYGPIYGEPVNGTVMGRPNGSVYVPSTNTISIQIQSDDYKYVMYWPYDSGDSRLRFCNSTGTETAGVVGLNPIFSAKSQDLANNMQLQIYSDSGLTDLVAYRDIAAGIFNGKYGDITDADEGLTDGQTLYLRAQLMSNGTAVATSDTIAITMVVLE